MEVNSIKFCSPLKITTREDFKFVLEKWHRLTIGLCVGLSRCVRNNSFINIDTTRCDIRFYYLSQSVWGSYWKDGQWGYGCCHSFIQESYCTGAAGKTAEQVSCMDTGIV